MVGQILSISMESPQKENNEEWREKRIIARQREKGVSVGTTRGAGESPQKEGGALEETYETVLSLCALLVFLEDE